MRDLSPEVRDFAKAHGLTPAQVRDMAKRSAVFTHEHGNRRYKHYVFQIEGRNIVSMFDLESGEFITKDPVLPALRPDEFVQFEECDHCRGKGCAICNFEGEVRYVRRMSSRKEGPMK